MKIIGTYRRDAQGEFLPETADAGQYKRQLARGAKMGRLLKDTRKDADILRCSGNGSSSGESMVVSDTTVGKTPDVRKATNLSYNAVSGEVQSYSARIIGPGERIKLEYSAHPLRLEVSAVKFSGNSGSLTRRIKLREVGDNLFELTES